MLPRRFGWLKSLLSPESHGYVTQFGGLLSENAEMQEVIAAAPGPVGRVLRPFCHFLGLEVPAALRLPKRVRKKDTPTPTLPRRAGEGANGADRARQRRDERSELIIPNRRLPAREQALDAMRRSEATGKAIRLPGFSAEALGWFLHWPRDGNCPPPKIGYAGRRRRPPKDYKPPKDWE